jgi:hypothetical protein
LLEATASSSTISLTWTDNSTDENGFRIDRSNGHGWTALKKVHANVTTFTSAGLKPGRTYAYRVFAYNKAGNSPPTFLSDAATLPVGGVSSTSELAATIVSPLDVVLQFKDNAKNEAGYNVQVSANGGEWVFAGGLGGSSGTGLRVFDFHATEGSQNYRFRVAGYTTTRVSDYSPPVAATASVANTRAPVLSGGQYYTSDVEVTNQVNGIPEPIYVVKLHLFNADGTPDTTFANTGSAAISETVNSDQQPAQFLAGLPNGMILESNIGEIHYSAPPPGSPSQFYSWFERVDVLGETATSLSFTFTTPHTPNPQSRPAPLLLFLLPDGQVLVASNGVIDPEIGLNTPTPEISVFDDLAHLIWTQPLTEAADAVIGLPNHLVAVVSGAAVTVFDANGNRVTH